jgi:deoxyribose-phosphate aldolase
MQIEYSYYDLASNEHETKENIKLASAFPIYSVSVLPYYIKLAKNCIGNEPIKISTIIDYPLGASDLITRITASKNAIKSGANVLEIVVPTQYLTNRKYDKFREDINNHIGLGLENKVEIKYILEYRLFTYEFLYKISQILIGHGVRDIYPSSGYFLDDINDNILAAALINKKNPDVNIICNGNLWNSDQISGIKKHKLYGLKVNSINGLNLVFQKLLKS